MKTIKLLGLLLSLLIINSCADQVEGFTDVEEENTADQVEDFADVEEEENTYQELWNNDEEERYSGFDLVTDLHPRYVFDNLWLGFQDASGNDLLKYIDFTDNADIYDDGNDRWRYGNGYVKRNLYSISYLYPDPKSNPFDINNYYNPNAPVWERPIFDKTDFDLVTVNSSFRFPEVSNRAFQFWLGNFRDFFNIPMADKVIIKLKCPFIFGDDKVYEIVTYWQPKEGMPYYRGNPYFGECYLVEFEGKEYIPQLLSDNPSGIARYSLVILEVDRD
jgi:hypothetical protein